MSSCRDIESPEYEEISTITRSLHLSQAMNSYFKQKLFSRKIVSKTVYLNVKVLWFAPTRPMDENNMYGNVSFTVDWETALEQFGPYLYYVDEQMNSMFCYGRVLLTNKKYEFLTPVDDGGDEMPMQLFDNKHYAVTASEGVQYVLEIGIEVDRHGESWFYKNCKIEANDHSSANTLLYAGGPYNSCICHKFNYFKIECPSPYKLQQTKMILEERCPSMLRNMPARKAARSRKKKRKKKKKTKQEVVVNDEGYYDDQVYDFYDEDQSYDFYDDYYVPTPKKKEDEGMSTGQKVFVGAIVAALFWYGRALWWR